MIIVIYIITFLVEFALGAHYCGFSLLQIYKMSLLSTSVDNIEIIFYLLGTHIRNKLNKIRSHLTHLPSHCQ